MLIHHRPSLRICLTALRLRLYAEERSRLSVKSAGHFVALFRGVIVLWFVYRAQLPSALVFRLSSLKSSPPHRRYWQAAGQLSLSAFPFAVCVRRRCTRSFRRSDFRNAPAPPPLAPTVGVLMFRKVALPYRAQVHLPPLPGWLSPYYVVNHAHIIRCHAIERTACNLQPR